MRAALALVPALLLAGCAAPGAQQNCFSSPTSASLLVQFDGDRDALFALLAEEGWNETAWPGTLPLPPTQPPGAFYASLGHDDAPGPVRVSGSSKDGTLQVFITFEGYHRGYTQEDARRDLAHLVEPLRERFDGDAHSITYRGGFDPCDLK